MKREINIYEDNAGNYHFYILVDDAVVFGNMFQPTKSELKEMKSFVNQIASDDEFMDCIYNLTFFNMIHMPIEDVMYDSNYKLEAFMTFNDADKFDTYDDTAEFFKNVSDRYHF